jgi:hypothetical protein
VPKKTVRDKMVRNIAMIRLGPFSRVAMLGDR